MNIDAYTAIELALIAITCLFIGFIVVGLRQAKRDYNVAAQKEELETLNTEHTQIPAKAA